MEKKILRPLLPEPEPATFRSQVRRSTTELSPIPVYVITIPLIFLPDAIRLAGRLEPHGGRLEVYNNGYWYAVCGLDFNQEEANVVCRHFGFPTWVYRQCNSYPLRWVIFSSFFLLFSSSSSFLRSVLCNTFRCCCRWLLWFWLLFVCLSLVDYATVIY